MSLRCTVFSAVLLIVCNGVLASERVPPQADCLDARKVEEFHVPSAWQISVALGDGQRFRLELASACEAATAPKAVLGLLAREGWVCGIGNEFLQVQGSEGLCPIAAVAPIEAREFARLAREAGQRSLAQIEVRGRAAGFGGSADFCFPASRVRSWAESSGGLQIEVGQRGRRGSRSYRVELDSTCPDLGRFENIDFQSGASNGLICGNTGDAVVVLDDGATLGATRMGSRCAIREVYPLDAAG
jgi:hypothetical protein